MSRITAHDVTQLTKLNAEVHRWNEEKGEINGVDMELSGPWRGWRVDVIQVATGTHIVWAAADTLGDAIVAAMKAWKEARDG